MTIINVNDLDKRMGQQIDPNSVPRHDGGDQGVMEGIIERGTDARAVHQGTGHHGAAVFDEREVGDNMFFGSKTIISVNDAPPLPEKFEPKAPGAQVPQVQGAKLPMPPGLPAGLAGILGRVKPVVASGAPQAPAVPPVAQTPAQQARSGMSTIAQLDMLKRLSAKKP